MPQDFQQAQRDEAEKLLEYGRSLIDLHRYAEAEANLRKSLARAPQSWKGHYFLGLALLAQADDHKQKLDEGIKEARTTIALRPELDSGYFLLAWGYLLGNKLTEALDTAHQGMRIDPQEPWGYSLVSQVYRRRSEWEKMLQSAQSGLKCDPTYTSLLNMQAEALLMLDRKEQAHEAVEMALRSDPSSSYAHANRGWLALYSEDSAQAVEHFREAMRLDPTSEVARQGLLQSLRARNPLYTQLLRYYLWTRRVSQSEFWGMIAIFSGINSAIRIGIRVFPPLVIIAAPYLLLYWLFSFFTWVGDSFFDFLLKLSPTGRLVLSNDESAAANGCGFMIGFFMIHAAALVAALFVHPGDFKYAWAFGVGMLLSLGMMTPIAGIYKVDASSVNRRTILLALAVLLGINAFFGWSGSLLMAPWQLLPLLIFLVGWLFYPLVASLVINIRG